MTRNWRAVVRYDGTRYQGFQVQPIGMTVQGEVERALAAVTGETVRLAGAGRTDAGVHAIGQVISFRLASALDGAKLGRGVNALLPADIAVSDVEPVGEGFHARFSARGRTYEYRIRNASAREPLERLRELLVPQALEVDAMRAAAARLCGRRDFSAFAAGLGGERTVRRTSLWREGSLVRFEIEADSFLRGMVRGIVGTLLWVGRGKITVDRFGEILESRDRSQAGPSAAARGLCLVAVEYGEREDGGRDAEGHEQDTRGEGE